MMENNKKIDAMEREIEEAEALRQKLLAICDEIENTKDQKQECAPEEPPTIVETNPAGAQGAPRNGSTTEPPYCMTRTPEKKTMTKVVRVDYWWCGEQSCTKLHQTEGSAARCPIAHPRPPKPPAPPRTAQAELRARKRTRNSEALSLRESGLTYRKVGERFGVSPSRAAQMVCTELRAREREKFRASCVCNRCGEDTYFWMELPCADAACPFAPQS